MRAPTEEEGREVSYREVTDSVINMLESVLYLAVAFLGFLLLLRTKKHHSGIWNV